MSEYLLGVATPRDELDSVGSGLLPRANEELEPGEVSSVDGDPCGRGVALVGGVSALSEV